MAASEELHARGTATRRRPQVEDGDAVVVERHLCHETCAQPDELDPSEVADEQRILQWLAEVLGGLVYPTQPARIADV
jgi:hypothetical protein